MKEKVKPNPQGTTTQDAELFAEAIQEEPKNAPDIDFDDDYELAQKMSGSSTDGKDDDEDVSASSDAVASSSQS